MAITTVNASYSGNGPAKSGQIVADRNAGDGSRVLRGTATVTGDGASSSFIVNLIDGTETLGFTPSGVICTRSGGAATGTISVVSAVATNTILTVTSSANINAATFSISFELIK